MSLEDNLAEQILDENDIDTNDMMTAISTSELLALVTSAVLQGFDKARLLSQPQKLPEKSIASLGGEATAARRATLTQKDLKKLSGTSLRVFRLLQDGEWHEAQCIREVGGSEGLRRAREFRFRGKTREPFFALIQRGAKHEYRLLKIAGINYDYDVSRLDFATEKEIAESTNKSKRQQVDP